MKSVQKKLADASELAAIYRISNADIEFVSISSAERISFRLTNAAFARLYSECKVPKKNLGFHEFTHSAEFEFYFYSRGAWFRTSVKLADVVSWKAALEASATVLIESKPKRLNNRAKQLRITHVLEAAS